MSAPSRYPPPLKSQLAAIAIVALVFGAGALLYLSIPGGSWARKGERMASGMNRKNGVAWIVMV